MVGKMVLPYFGGAAAVWTTCVLFFQTMLLAGYVYAHILGRMPDHRKQILTHMLVLLVPLLFLPISFAGPGSYSQNPSVRLLLQLAAAAGIPFFVVSTTAPLLQNWLSRVEDASAHDPYFLYSASNAGSLMALVAYPFFMEPRFGITAQTRLWSAGYIGLLFMLGIAFAVVWERPKQRPAWDSDPAQTRPDSRTRFYWVAAAFVPSALMLAVTNHIAANLASAPFLWIVPLAIYLLTFILAFARRFYVSSTRISRIIPVVLLGVFPLVAAGVVAPPGLNWMIIVAHLVLLYSGALLCHTALAERRPSPVHLTEFYFWIAFGGVLGGIFTATIAPMAFNTIIEYPVLVALLPFFRSGKDKTFNVLIPISFGIAILAAWTIFRAAHLDSNSEALAFAHTALFFAAYKLKNHIRQFALSFVILIMAYAVILPGYIEGASRVYTNRNFFGVKKVLDDRSTHLRKLLHGDTIHGIERTDPSRAGQPLSYYYSDGNVDQIVRLMRNRGRRQRFGVLGLGSGTMAAYADANTSMTFYEIDPAVEPIARRFFTFLSRCGSNCDLVLGDGRLRVAETPRNSYDLLMLDAFSSDSVPAHLLSREAVQLYLSKLTPDGVLLFHVSNRYLDIERLVAALIGDAGLVGFSRFDDAGDLREMGKSSSSHVVAARRLEDINAIATHSGWVRVSTPPDFKPWTDDYSNLLSLTRWHLSVFGM